MAVRADDSKPCCGTPCVLAFKTLQDACRTVLAAATFCVRDHVRASRKTPKNVFILTDIFHEAYRRRKDRDYDIFRSRVRENSVFCDVDFEILFIPEMCDSTTSYNENYEQLKTYVFKRSKASTTSECGNARLMRIAYGLWNGLPSCQMTPTS